MHTVRSRRPSPRPATKRPLRVGIIELLTDTRARGWAEHLYARYLTRQYASITPQAVAVWCRALGHQVHYRTFYGQADPHRLLPRDLDVLFVGAYTRASGLAYALARIYGRRGTLTVIGGPHARAFPADCLRYFDLVVRDCDRELVADIVAGRFDRPSVVTSGRPLADIPSVEERLPDIRVASFYDGRPTASSAVGLLSSVGCPYTCDFCTDWDNPYATISPDQLEADLRYLSAHLPQVFVAYHDPNFGVRFDETMAVIERLPKARRNRYAMESSLAILKTGRLERLRETRCVFIAPGVESWSDYSGKAGVGARQGQEKLDQVVAHFEELGRHVPGLQANFLFGLDGDRGAEPVELTKAFIRRLPGVMPTINIPTPLGGTPLFDAMRRDGRILEAMPFALYFTYSSAVTTFRHYDPIAYFDHLVDLYATNGSAGMLARRLAHRTHPYARFLNAVRTLATRRDVGALRTVRDLLATDREFLAFHEGRTQTLPEYYHRAVEARLGPYAELLPRAERRPVLDPIPLAPGRTAVSVPRSDLVAAGA